jgi:peptidase E
MRKTKYLLHGGNPGTDHTSNDKFFQGMVTDVEKEEIVILLCYFSRDKESWESLTDNDINNFTRNNPKSKFEFHTAEEDLDTFKEQIDLADIVYFRGGNTDLLLRRISPLADQLTELFSGKVIAGSSAGVDFLAENYNGISIPGVHQGLGILPLDVVVHSDNREDVPKKSLENMRKFSEENGNRLIEVPECIHREFEYQPKTEELEEIKVSGTDI